MARRHRHSGNCRGRCRQHQGARTCGYQHREHRLRVMGDKPGHRRQQQHQHHVAAGIAFKQTGDRRLRTLGVLHQRDDFAQRRLITGAGHLNAQQAIEVDRAAKHRHAHCRFHWHRLAGNRRRVEAGLAEQHPTIRGHTIPGAHLDRVTGLERAVVDFNDRAVRLNLARVAAGQLAEGVDRFLRTDHAALFQHVAEDHDDRQQRGGQQIASRPRTEHRQSNQLIGDAVQARITQAVPSRAHHRHRY